jgi:hypothetical protein
LNAQTTVQGASVVPQFCATTPPRLVQVPSAGLAKPKHFEAVQDCLGLQLVVWQPRPPFAAWLALAAC